MNNIKAKLHKVCKKIILAIFAICIVFFSPTLFSEHVISLFQGDNTNASISTQFRFFSDCPVGNIPTEMQTSPVAYNSVGEKVAPYFYVVPTEHLSEVTSNYLKMKEYSISSRLFLDETTNLIVIAPIEPLSYNTYYSVVFNKFPLLEPDINTELGYKKIEYNSVFDNYIKTINAPLSITEVSFQKTGNIVWNINENIVLEFSKPISPNLVLLDSIFRVIKSGNATTNTDGTLDYDFEVLSTTATLSSDGKSVTIEHSEPFEYGSSYFLDVNWEHYLGDDIYNTNYDFYVSSYFVVNIKVHFPAGLPDGEFRSRGYDGQKLYYAGDTVRVGFPATYKEYYLSSWKLTETTKGTLTQNGEHLELILDAEHYFSNAHNNPAFAEIKKTGITIDVYYNYNPIDTLYISSNIADSLSTSYPNYYKYLTASGIKEKINNGIYTHYRYSDRPVFINYDFGDTLISSFWNDSVSAFVQQNSLTLVPPTTFPADAISFTTSAVAANGGYPHINPKKDTIIIVIKEDYDKKRFLCEGGYFSVELNYMGFGTDRAFENELTPLYTELVKSVVLRDCYDTNYFPTFIDTTQIKDNRASIPIFFNNCNADKYEPTRATYSVTLGHPDYEIFLVTTKYGPHKCTVDGDVVKRANYKDNDIYENYRLKGANLVSGEIFTRNYNGCNNVLKIYIRKKIVEFAFSYKDTAFAYGGNHVRTINLKYFRLKFPELPPISTIKNTSYLPVTNYPLHKDSSWYKFVGIDKPIADFTYHRRCGDIEYSYSTDPNYRENIYRERVSVFYYSGESFSYVPYVEENCGFKLKTMTMPENSAFNAQTNPVTKLVEEVKIMGFRKSEEILLGNGLGFVLEYIEVPKPRKTGDTTFGPTNYLWKRYAVDDYHAEKYGIPIWRDGILDDYDNGLYLDEECGGLNTLDQYTLSIYFQFNKEVFEESMSNGFNIYDFRDKPPYNLLRPDSNECTNYPIVFDKPGSTDGNATQGYITNTGSLIYFAFVYKPTMPGYKPPNKNGDWHDMCNLQRFHIDITNTKNNPILAYDGWHGKVLEDTLSNIKIFRRLKGSTIPPILASRAIAFNNIDLHDPGWFQDSAADIYIHLFSELNLDDRVNPLKNVNPKVDSLGKIEFKVETKRFPDNDFWEMDMNSTKDISNYDFDDVYLHSAQRILHSFHWTEDDGIRSCKKIIDVTAAAVKLGLKLLKINDVDTVVSIAAEMAKEYSCSNDDYEGSNNFWLAKAGRTAYKNNQYKYASGVCGAPNDSVALEFFNRNMKQDWNLWGNGTYGMYNPPVKREAYNTSFNFVEVVIDRCHPLNKVLPFCYRFIFTSKPKFFTTIEVWTGDN